MKSWPWRRQRITDAEADESKKRLRQVQSRQQTVDDITRHAEEIIRRNHLAESIHRALGGHP